MQVPVALQSLLIQCAGVALVALLAALLPFESPPALWLLALAQGSVAAMLSRLWRQPVWWQPLHFAFMPLAWLMQGAGAPPWIYLAAFLVLLLVYWTTFRTRVPLYLSDGKAWQAVESLLPHDRPFHFVDLGSGLGGVPFYLESRLPHGTFTGTEIAPVPWLISRLRAGLRRSRVTFLRRDYETLDLGAFDVVFAFLSPAAMPRLWQQVESQMRAGTLFISLSFPAPGREPDRVVRLADGARHTLYAWHM